MMHKVNTIRSKLGTLSLLVSIMWFASPAFAEPSFTQSQAKLLARRAAEADCYRKLAETVYGIQIDSETFVLDFVAESDEIRSAVDAFITGVRLGTPRYFDDGTCEIDAELSEFDRQIRGICIPNLAGENLVADHKKRRRGHAR